LCALDKTNHRVGFVRSKAFYGRQKVHLADLRQVRAEMGVCYRAAVRQQLDWVDLRAAIAALSAMASLDQGAVADQRLAMIEERLGTRPNGHDREARPS
jgi:hypothetical protein